MASSPFNSSRFVAIQHRGAREFVCVDAGTATVHAAWTGTGELVRVSESFRATSNTFTEVFRFWGTFRDATATGGINGTDFGTSQFADIFNASSAGRVRLPRLLAALPVPLR
jgi:hypothetical protein